MLIKNKRGQVTIFIIIALVIVALVVLLSYFWNDVKTFTQETNPQTFLETCLDEPMKQATSRVLLAGGVAENKNYYFYKNHKIEYLCYTNEYYKTCVLQQPFLKETVNKEISNLLRPLVNTCLESLRSEMQSKGFTINAQRPLADSRLNISDRKMELIINYPISFTKTDSSSSYTTFKIVKKSEVYSLLMSAVYILNWEARYGDFDTLSFMMSYPDLRLEKQKQSDGSKIYLLSSRSTGEEFYFASRSISWPAGLVYDEIIIEGEENV